MGVWGTASSTMLFSGPPEVIFKVKRSYLKVKLPKLQATTVYFCSTCSSKLDGLDVVWRNLGKTDILMKSWQRCATEQRVICHHPMCATYPAAESWDGVLHVIGYHVGLHVFQPIANTVQLPVRYIYNTSLLRIYSNSALKFCGVLFFWVVFSFCTVFLLCLLSCIFPCSCLTPLPISGNNDPPYLTFGADVGVGNVQRPDHQVGPLCFSENAEVRIRYDRRV